MKQKLRLETGLLNTSLVGELDQGEALVEEGRQVADVCVLGPSPEGNCIKIRVPGKLILRDYFQENRTSGRQFISQHSFRFNKMSQWELLI